MLPGNSALGVYMGAPFDFEGSSGCINGVQDVGNISTLTSEMVFWIVLGIFV